MKQSILPHSYVAPICRVVSFSESALICASGITIPGYLDETTLFDED